MKKMKIDIWSDIACPFCFIGLKKLKKSLSQFEHKDEIEIKWHSYELNPDLPETALEISYLEYMADMKEASEDKAQKDLDNLVKQGKEVGIDYNFDKLIIANTHKALRLVKLAAQKDLATEAEEALFEAFFSNGKDISDNVTLVAIGKAIGLDAADVEQMLSGDTFSKEVNKDTEYGDIELNLEYIPYFRFNKKNVIQGTVSESDFIKTLKKSFDDWKANGEGNEPGESLSGQSCSIDGVCS